MEQIQMVQVEDLRPHEKNPRIDAASVADLVESIRVHGIEVPLVAAPQLGAEGYVVLAGHRRLTAAHEVGLTELPVQIREDLADAQEQLAFMATENIHRDQLTAVEESRLLQDMLNLGMTQAEVAKQTALGKQRVKDRVKLGKLATDTGEKVHRGQITVDDALLIAEYSDDPDSITALEEAAGTHMFEWEVSRAKRRREQAKLVEDARKLAKKLELRLVDEDSDFVGLAGLLTDVGWTTPALTEAGESEVSGQVWDDLVKAEHESCPGHSARIITTGYDAGALQLGCDQVAERHGTSPTEDAAPEPEPADPWDDITAEDFEAARIHREQHLAKAIPDVDALDEAMDIAVQGVLSMGWHEYYDDQEGIALLEAITGAEGKARVRKALHRFPLQVLVWLGAHTFPLKNDHRAMAQGRQGSSYWGEKGKFRQILERTGYEWSEPEQKAILLATGKAHDATDDEAAEGGEAA